MKRLKGKSGREKEYRTLVRDPLYVGLLQLQAWFNNKSVYSNFRTTVNGGRGLF